MRYVASATIRRNEFGEYVVRPRDQNGKRMPECDYFASDRTDAIQARELMTRKYRQFFASTAGNGQWTGLGD